MFNFFPVTTVFGIVIYTLSSAFTGNFCVIYSRICLVIVVGKYIVVVSRKMKEKKKS